MPTPRTDPTCPVCSAQAAGRAGRWNELAVWRCEGCDHRFVAPVPDPSQLAAIYEAGYYQGSTRYCRRHLPFPAQIPGRSGILNSHPAQQLCPRGAIRQVSRPNSRNTSAVC